MVPCTTNVFIDIESHYVVQADLKPLASSEPPSLASQSAENIKKKYILLCIFEVYNMMFISMG